MQTLVEFRSLFEPRLEDFFMKKISSYSALTKNQDITELIAYTEKLARGGGKRIRPFLAWLMYQGLAGKKQEAILDASIALEIFHLFGLMHDDIIDRGTDRHGIPTVHLAVMKRLKQQKRIGDLHHIGEGQAMLLGDLLFSWSVEIMTNTIKFGEKKHAQAQQRFFRMVDEVILGQMLDVETMTNSIANMQSIEEKMRLKTASYTCIRPLQIGAALAGTNERIDLFCKNIGLSLGLAFQIQDDFLDLTADQKKIKKTVFSDLTEHQHTIFTQYIFDQGTRAQKNELKSLMGSPLDEKDRPRILELFETSGAFSYGKKQIEAHFNQAEDCLQSFKLKPIAKTGLSDLLMYLRHRQI